MFKLNGRVAVITGASSGLGKQMAMSFARQGANLVLLARRIERLEELKKELEKENIKVLPIKCDVTSTEDINNAAKLAEETFGKVTATFGRGRLLFLCFYQLYNQRHDNHQDYQHDLHFFKF